MKLLFPAHETGVPCQWNSCANKMEQAWHCVLAYHPEKEFCLAKVEL